LPDFQLKKSPKSIIGLVSSKQYRRMLKFYNFNIHLLNMHDCHIRLAFCFGAKIHIVVKLKNFFGSSIWKNNKNLWLLKKKIPKLQKEHSLKFEKEFLTNLKICQIFIHDSSISTPKYIKDVFSSFHILLIAKLSKWLIDMITTLVTSQNWDFFSSKKLCL
jgi:hypothetical protein